MRLMRGRGVGVRLNESVLESDMCETVLNVDESQPMGVMSECQSCWGSGSMGVDGREWDCWSCKGVGSLRRGMRRGASDV
jgi:DnaJ-class molecular chaperone